MFLPFCVISTCLQTLYINCYSPRLYGPFSPLICCLWVRHNPLNFIYHASFHLSFFIPIVMWSAIRHNTMCFSCLTAKAVHMHDMQAGTSDVYRHVVVITVLCHYSVTAVARWSHDCCIGFTRPRYSKIRPDMPHEHIPALQCSMNKHPCVMVWVGRCGCATTCRLVQARAPANSRPVVLIARKCSSEVFQRPCSSPCSVGATRAGCIECLLQLAHCLHTARQ